jgi:hypothetical protein
MADNKIKDRDTKDPPKAKKPTAKPQPLDKTIGIGEAEEGEGSPGLTITGGGGHA